MSDFSARAVRRARSTQFGFNLCTNGQLISAGKHPSLLLTGNVPGKAASKVETFVFGASADSEVNESLNIEPLGTFNMAIYSRETHWRITCVET
jgi:hypothetical protein